MHFPDKIALKSIKSMKNSSAPSLTWTHSIFGFSLKPPWAWSQQRIQGAWGPGPLAPQDFFKIMQISGSLKGKPYCEPYFRLRAPLGVKTPLGPTPDQNLGSAPGSSELAATHISQTRNTKSDEHADKSHLAGEFNLTKPAEGSLVEKAWIRCHTFSMPMPLHRDHFQEQNTHKNDSHQQHHFCRTLANKHPAFCILERETHFHVRCTCPSFLFRC